MYRSLSEEASFLDSVQAEKQIVKMKAEIITFFPEGWWMSFVVLASLGF